MEIKEWYLEISLENANKQHLESVRSLLNLLSVNLVAINDVERGILIKARAHLDAKQLIRFNFPTGMKVTTIREASTDDRIKILYGSYMGRCEGNRKVYRFVRKEIGTLVEFMAELFKEKGSKLIGIRGLPRVGKTESIVAASVCANKRWILTSSTLLRQTVRSNLTNDEYSQEYIYIIDGIVSTARASEKHRKLISEIMDMQSTKVIEHPDIFIRETDYTMDDFDYIIELRNDHDEMITYENIETGFSSFDIS